MVVLGYISEKSTTTSEQWLWFLVASVAYLILWGPIIITFAQGINDIPQEENSVKGILAAGISAFTLVYSSFAVVAAYNIYTRFRNYYKSEILYIVLSLVSKTLLHWVLFYSLLSRGERLYNANNPNGTGTTYSSTGVYASIGLSVGGGIILAIVFYVLWIKNAGGDVWIECKKVITNLKKTTEISTKFIEQKLHVF